MNFRGGRMPYLSPPVPFTGSIQGGLQDGLEITINGMVLPSDGNSTHLDGSQGPTGLLANTASFCWQVMVNGSYFVEYQHRIPFQWVDTITVNGMVQLTYISFMESFGSFSGQKYNLPFHASVYGGLYAGKFLLVLGSVLPTADRFEINLRSGNDIAFHLNPRFQENTIVRNSHINSSWGPEERALSSVMPFIKGQTFMVLITCEAQGFKVTVNGQYLFSYNHRVKNLSSINMLEVAGDIQLNHVQV
ncbi:galectin-9-like [Gracilinanus agilis]|uniref:galectin-9-like n=1 Tax=Gracilinanus agilis TaxID=191870 RepID=UPI001CFEBE45|nr:galectin-9-like [Gracilinanus agilis]